MFDKNIQDNPLDFLKQTKTSMHVPAKVVYSTLSIIDSLTSLFTLKQQEQEDLITYLDRFNIDNNLVRSVLWRRLIDTYVKN